MTILRYLKKIQFFIKSYVVYCYVMVKKINYVKPLKILRSTFKIELQMFLIRQNIQTFYRC